MQKKCTTNGISELYRQQIINERVQAYIHARAKVIKEYNIKTKYIMKNVITYLKTLWRWGLDSQSSDVSLDCRLTVGSPSVKYASTLMRLVAISAFLLTIGVGNVWGAEKTAYTLSGTTTGGTSGYTTQSITQSSKNWTVQGNTNVSPWRIGISKGNGDGTDDFPIYSQTAISEDVTKIILSHGDVSRATVNSVTIQVYSTAALAAAGGDGDVDANIASSDSWAASSSMTFNKPAGHNWANRFYRIVYNMDYSTTSGKSGKPAYMQFSSAVFKYDDSPSCSAPAAPTISGTAAYTAGQTITLTASCASGADASTTYTWYKGADWATARAASPVQATSTSGATFTKASCVVGDAGKYWCEASNGSGCEAHNSTGYDVTVSAGSVAVTGVSVDPTSKSIVPGETFTITPTISPADATDKSVSWTSSATSYATVNSSGVVTGVAAGSSTITCKTNDGNFTATCAVTVRAVTLQARDEDGNAIAAGGPGAPTRSGTTITAAANSGNYVFKQWDVVNATAASSTTSPTTISDPTGAVTVTAVYYKPVTITYKANGATFTTQTYARGGTLAFPVSEPDGATYSCTGKTFVGWVGEANKDYSDASTPPTYATAGGSVTAAATYYAVFADAASGGTTTKTDEFTYTSFFAACNPSGSNTSGVYTAFTKSGSESDAVYAGMLNKHGNGVNCHDYIQMRTSSNNSGIVTTTSGGKAKKVTVEWNSTTGNEKVVNIYGKNTAYSAASELYDDETDGDLLGTITKGTSTEYTITGDYEYIGIRSNGGAIYFDEISIDWQAGGGVTYSNYATTCCTALGTINGSVSWSNAATAVVSWDNIDHVSSWTVKYKTHAAGDYSTWAGEQTVYTKSTTNDSRKVTITGLTPCTNYDFQIIANPASGYCDKDQTIEDSQTHNWTVTSTGVTHATASPAIPSTTCSGFSTTISPATGYALPADITVTNASKSWNSSTGALSISSVTGNVSITITPTCVSPVISGDPADASYYVGDSPDALSVSATLASGTLTYLWKVSTNGGSTWSDATGTNNAATYSGASLSTASAGTLKFKCIVGNSQGGCTVESGVATITVSNPSYFPKGKTIFIQAHSTSAWTGDGCVMAWFHTSGGSETAQPTYWLFDATGDDSGKKLFATVAPATGDLPYLDIQRFAANCSTWWNKNGGCSYADASGSNAIRSTGKHDTSSDGDYVRWNATGVTLDLYGDPSGDAWASSLASFSDQGAGVWTATYNNYAPANAAGESQNFKAKTNYNGWIGNYIDSDHSNSDATLDGMHVGSTYNITATLDVTDHSLTMSKTYVKGTVHFDLQGHGSSISDLTNVTAGSKISAPSAPSATGYTFGGWYKEPACTNAWTFASDVVNETMTLYAKWTANVYTITANLTGTSVNTAFPSSFIYTGSTTTNLNRTFSVNTTNYFMPSSIAVTMGGTPLTAGTDYTYNNSTGAFTFSAVITGDIVITAAATAKLKSIAITTQPTSRKYFAGESFSSTGAVVTATMGDGSTKAVTASATWTPPATPLAAGTGLTVTASYTENAINMTATTTIDVYSVTVNKQNEDGDAIDVAGVTATWTVGSKALAAGVGSTKYAFKEWQVTGATAASTTSASTTLSNPTANVVVNAVFYKPRVVKWSVNGNDSYNTGGPTTEVAYNGTISTIPTAPSGLVCASTFVAWTDAAHNNGTTAKTSTSYYESKLFTAANQFPNITAETTTFYAVFAEGTGAAVNTVMWSEDWTGATSSSGSGTPSPSDARPSAQGDHSGKTVYGGATITYTDGTGTYVRTNENNAGGTAPELLIKGNENWTISGIPTGGAATLTLEYRTNGTLTVSTSTDNVSIGTKSGSNPYTNTITVGSGVTSFNLSFTQTSNRRIDNVSVKVASVNLTNYVTECDANMIRVTYDANGGMTGCENETTDKREDYTVCSSAPTRDYYTFAGWLCSADDEVYAASATISAAAIDADFTLTAQWTPVTYTITYNLHGGTTAGGNPTTYDVETATIDLADGTYGHNRFEGWYSTYNDGTGAYSDQVTSIPLGSHGDITLHAKWTTRHEIVFDADGETTTIYRADDEAMDASVAGQGSVPSDPSAPTACSSKVFVGWSESTIDGETDDEPADLMKPAAGTVDEDKEFHAVWATESSESGTHDLVDDDFNVTGTDAVTSRSGWTGLSTVYGGSGSIRFSSGSYAGSMTLVKTGLNFGTLVTSATITFKIKKYGSDGSGVLNISSYFGDATTTFSKDGGETTSTTVSYSTTDGSNWTTCTCTVGSISASSDIILEGQANARVHVKDFKITYTGTKYTYAAYSTSCCATKVTLSDPSITDASSSGSTLTFDKSSPVWTCGGTKTVTATLTLTAGYQASALSFSVNSGTVSVSPAISTPVTSSQVYTLTFAEDQDATLTTTATIAAKPLNSITITPSSGEVYVGQYADFTVSYDPADYLSPGYTLKATPVYVAKETAAPANTKLRLKGGRASGPGASITETVNETVTIQASGDNTKTASVNITVNPLPRVHFEDLVHGKEFADVVATLSENALNPNKTTKTSVDWTTPNANDCESDHLHLVGWIRSDWPALVAYLNGTGDAPTTVAITGAGNDGSGNAYFFAPNASINVLTFNGATFYAVWAEIK